MTPQNQDIAAANDRLLPYIDGEKVRGTALGTGPDGRPNITVFGHEIDDRTKAEMSREVAGHPIEFTEGPKYIAYPAPRT